MNVDPTTGTVSTGALPSPSAASPGQLGKEEFLELLVAQLSNQDPLNPLDPSGFSSQLAEFSALEQLIALNDNFAARSASDALVALSLNTNLAASLLGTDVLAVGTAAVVDNGTGEVTVDVADAGGTATLKLFDPAGNEIAARDLGGVGGGRQVLSLEQLGVDSGTYRYEVTVTAPDGSPVPVTHYVAGVVDGVQFESGGLMLRIGGVLVPLNHIVEFQAG